MGAGHIDPRPWRIVNPLPLFSLALKQGLERKEKPQSAKITMLSCVSSDQLYSPQAFSL